MTIDCTLLLLFPQRGKLLKGHVALRGLSTEAAKAASTDTMSGAGASKGVKEGMPHYEKRGNSVADLLSKHNVIKTSSGGPAGSSALVFGSESLGASSSADLEAPAASAAGTTADEYPTVHTFNASEVNLKELVMGNPSEAMLRMVQKGPDRGTPIPGDWKAFKKTAPVDIAGTLNALGDIFSGDSKTHGVIQELKVSIAQ